MPCRHCGHEFLEPAKFCPECGRRLAEQSQTSATVERRGYTPRHLADKILSSRAALEGERKQVTVLFADVKGSMELAEQIDAEEWHRILDRFFAILTDGVHRFEGTINQYTGDGIMALFGAPIAHEDHAQRACYAALQLREQLRQYADELRRVQGLNFAVRIGINSGEVVVGKIGDDLRMDYTAQGYTVGLAARMEQLAEPGSVLLAEDTAKLVAGFFQLRDLGAFAVKGVHTRPRGYELQGVGALRTRFDQSRARGLSKFVGRTDEMATLQRALQEAQAGRGGIIGVAAEAGVGKSRLCHEFAERCKAHGMVVRAGHAVPHGNTIPFLPLLEVLRSYFEIAEQDRADVVRHKVAGTLLLLDRQFEDALPLLFDFLGVPDPERPLPMMAPEVRQPRLFDVLRQLIQAKSRRHPEVILMEDLHWIDGGTEAFLASAVAAVEATRTLLLVNYRPTYRADWMRLPGYREIALQPLAGQAIDELLDALLGCDPSLAGLRERIRERTGGNPFFVEEVVRGLVDAGSLHGAKGAYRLHVAVDSIAIPRSVQAVLAARIDRLGEREKQLLRVASVIGKRFAEDVLWRVADQPEAEMAEALRRLVDAEFLQEEAIYPATEYSFRHPLTQEVAYSSQLADRRARTHAALARVLADAPAEKLGERAALVAHHWEAAGEALEAARWHQRAADWASGRHAGETVSHLRRAQALLAGVPETPEAINLGIQTRTALLRVGPFVGLGVDEAAAAFAEGRHMAERSGDRQVLAQLASTYGYFQMSSGDVNEARLRFQEAADLVQGTEDAEMKARLGLDDAQALLWAGRVRDALQITEEVLPILRNAGNAGIEGFSVGLGGEAFALALKGLGLAFLGKIEEGGSCLDEVLTLARERGEPEGVCLAHCFRAVIAITRGDAAALLGEARLAVEVAEKIGVPFFQILARLNLATAHVQLQEWQQAGTLFASAQALGHESGTMSVFESYFAAFIAETTLHLGDAARARAAAEEAIAAARQRGFTLSEAVTQLVLARICLAREGAPAVVDCEAALQRVQELMDDTGAISLEPSLHLCRAELAERRGDLAEAARERRAALCMAKQIGATGVVAQLEPQTESDVT